MVLQNLPLTHLDYSGKKSNPLTKQMYNQMPQLKLHLEKEFQEFKKNHEEMRQLASIRRSEVNNNTSNNSSNYHVNTQWSNSSN